jgi:hypothetical protein
MRIVAIILSILAVPALGQVGPSRAHPIAGATKKLPMMLIDQKPRKVVMDVDVNAEGRVTATRLVERSGNGVFDERMRGYWKDTLFMPALDAAGQPTTDTLPITNSYSVDEKGSLTLKDLRNHSEIENGSPADEAMRIQRMKCSDFLWEYDFMKQRAPKANLQHEQLFHVAFGMFLAAGNLNETARDALIGEWPKLVERTVNGCREQPQAAYWKDVFVPLFERARPYQSPPVP